MARAGGRRDLTRTATDDDLPDCLRMAREFCKAAGLPGDDGSMLATLRTLMDAGGLFVTGSPVHGMAGVLVYPAYFNTSRIAAQELFWWVDPDARRSGAGRALLGAIEAYARQAGAHTLTMICLDDVDGDRVAAFYRSEGYRPLERNFVKVL